MTYEKLLKDTIHGCWWCGKPVHLRFQNKYSNSYSDSYWIGEHIKYQIRCENIIDHARCHVGTKQFSTKYKDRYGKEYGQEDARELCIESWNSGEVQLPFIVSLPTNHFVVEKTKMESEVSYFKAYRMEIYVPKDRDIAATFKKKLSIALNYDGTPTNHTFRLVDSMVTYYETKIINVEDNPKTNYGLVSFVFESRNCSYFEGKNKADVAWLKSETVRPPIWDHIYNIFEKD